MLKQIIFATVLCCGISTLAITSSIEHTPAQTSDQTSDWIYLSGSDRGKLYLSKNVARHPKQPSRVFYSFLIVLTSPIAIREDDVQATSIRGEVIGSCESPSAKLLSLTLFDQSGTQITKVNPKTMPIDRKEMIENVKPGSFGGAFLKTACKISKK